ncbi:hypothetical protein [Rhodococcus opacus]|uniref:hypothetical protein n=1 Tax=Rhodococcus opacus TaxID=37919 RepID=UPI001C491A02|nr:hypothetical protein [Rhodococcus opacus]MBV6762653.1 hypothetical protein [Rhodococcus opacus]
MFFALTSASGAPGVSTTALGLALSSPSDRVLFVEADPVGSSPVHAGYLQSAREAFDRRGDRSLINLVDPTRRGQISSAFAEQAVPLPGSDVWVIPGLKRTIQADAMTSTWAPLGAHLSGLSRRGATVIVDAGRLGHRSGPDDLIRQADLIAIVTRPTLTALSALHGSLEVLRARLEATKAPAAIGLILIGTSPYTAAEVTKTVNLDVITTIPDSPLHAKVFSEGAELTAFRRTRSTYLRALRNSWPRLGSYIDDHRPEWVNAPRYTSALTAGSASSLTPGGIHA